jgi:hypothetical protein
MSPVSAVIAFLSLCALTGCVSYSFKEVDTTTPIQARHDIPEHELLDVGIVVFDPGIPADEKQREEEGVYPQVRKAESRYIPFTLKETLQNTAQWGAVRVIPTGTNSVDVQVRGKIIHSDGETLTLDIEAKDASGREWLKKRYTYSTSEYAYSEDLPVKDMDPFQDIYDTIANDLLAARNRLSSNDIQDIRIISELKFAGDLSPYAFKESLSRNDEGDYEIQRLPARGDPMLTRVRGIRQREYMFIDTLDAYYANFYRGMQGPYKDWREASYDETVALQEIKGSALKRMLLGAASVIGGFALAAGSESAASSAVGNIAVLGGAAALATGVDKYSQSQIHADALEELGASFEAEAKPRVVELEDKTVTLTGSLEAQFKEWRRMLKEIYETETGFSLGNRAHGEPQQTRNL